MLFHQLKLLLVFFVLGLGVSCASQKLKTAHSSQPKDINLRRPATFSPDLYADQSMEECPDLAGQYECQEDTTARFITEAIEGSHKLYHFDRVAGEVLNIVADGKARLINRTTGIKDPRWYLAYCKDKELIYLESLLPSNFQSIVNVQFASSVHRWKRTEDKRLHYETMNIIVSQDENQNPFNFNEGSCAFVRGP